ncbi:hypothetical protein PENSPDRAFT_667958 [Peniophora sp. CONT]|nr:hypothetical protein PENSPDRAFT_667958 [Peniophora sp. CONT]
MRSLRIEQDDELSNMSLLLEKEGEGEYPVSHHKPGTRPYAYAYNLDPYAQLSGPETSFFAGVLFRTYVSWAAADVDAKVGRREVVDYDSGAVDDGSDYGRKVESWMKKERSHSISRWRSNDALRPFRPVFARGLARMTPHEVYFEELERANVDCFIGEPLDVDKLMISTGTAIEDVWELSGWSD